MASRYPVRAYQAHTPRKVKQLDESTIRIIEGLNALLMQAQSEKLVTVSTVLEDARDSIAWWATYDDYAEDHSELLARQLAFSSGLNVAAILLAKLAAVKDETIRQEILELIQGRAT